MVVEIYIYIIVTHIIMNRMAYLGVTTTSICTEVTLRILLAATGVCDI
jgi:hypothetical protein